MCFLCLKLYSLYWLEGATEFELGAWERLKENVKEQGVLIVEAESKEILEGEHKRLVEEGWELAHIGSGVFRRVSSYSK
jgi:hypothetical protein